MRRKIHLTFYTFIPKLLTNQRVDRRPSCCAPLSAVLQSPGQLVSPRCVGPLHPRLRLLSAVASDRRVARGQDDPAGHLCHVAARSEEQLRVPAPDRGSGQWISELSSVFSFSLFSARIPEVGARDSVPGAAETTGGLGIQQHPPVEHVGRGEIRAPPVVWILWHTVVGFPFAHPPFSPPPLACSRAPSIPRASLSDSE